MSEAQLKAAVVDALRFIPRVHVMRLNAGLTIVGKGDSRRAVNGCEAGTPDLLVLLPGARVLWLELKTDVGRVSSTQRAWHERARELGHTVHVVRDTRDAIDLVMREKAKVTL